MAIWQPLRWFIDVFNLVIGFEVVPGLTLGAISLGFLTIVLIFRMIIFPLTGGSISSAISGVSHGIKNRCSDRSTSQRKENK